MDQHATRLPQKPENPEKFSQIDAVWWFPWRANRRYLNICTSMTATNMTAKICAIHVNTATMKPS